MPFLKGRVNSRCKALQSLSYISLDFYISPEANSELLFYEKTLTILLDYYDRSYEAANPGICMYNTLYWKEKEEKGFTIPKGSYHLY